MLLLAASATVQSQLLSWSPDFIQESSTPIEITVDATKGNQGLKDYTSTSDVYVHIGAITSLSTGSSDWKYSKFTWATTPPAGQCSFVSANKWKYTITGGLRAYFGISNPTEKILKIAILFRSGDGTKVQRNTDGSDMYIPVYEAGLETRLTEPSRQPTFIPLAETITKTIGDNIAITAKASQAAALKLYFNGNQIASQTNATTISANPMIAAGGQQTIVAEAVAGSVTKTDTLRFFVAGTVNVAPLPTGVVDGINYEPGDTSVTLVLFAPLKTRIAVLGDFNNWTESVQHQMNRTSDGNRFWLRITGLTPGVEYAYQYLIDGVLKVADYNAEKVLDPNNDPFIPSTTYPNLKPYPTGKTTGIVSVLQTAKPAYTWQVPNFSRPDKRNLVVYELLVRDFIATQNWQTLKDTLTYLKRLGVNAIELMPFNEFEGNISWGYNPSFYFAPDKIYGTENALRQFIDECHKQGIAVVMDIALNHTFGQGPTVQMYWNSALNRPAANSPWYNEVPKHAFNVGFDFNHESQATKDLVDRVVEHWLVKYKIDGYRFDLSKGFTQVQTCDANGGNCNVGTWGSYDASRVAIWQRIYNKMQAAAPNSYCILEHFADNSEEIDLSNRGMMLWGNLNHNYGEAGMGWVANSNLASGIFTARSWTQPHLITYKESHDEERNMYRNLNFGNNSNPAHNTRDLNTALKRMELTTAFWATIPGPKMMWQFEELGYDYSINYCQNGTINNNCRTDPKPITWNYYTNPNRKALYDVYAKLLALRKVPNFLSTFTSNQITYNLSGAFKWLQVNTDSLKLMVIGNFDVVAQSGNVTFPTAGTWYNYLPGGTKTATGAQENITLQPGEYYVYLNRDVANLIATPVRNVNSAIRNMRVSIYPNPVNYFATVEYDLPESGNVNVSVYNMMGQRLGVLFNGFKPRGAQRLPLNSASFNTQKLANGNYVLQIEVNGTKRVEQFVIQH